MSLKKIRELEKYWILNTCLLPWHSIPTPANNSLSKQSTRVFCNPKLTKEWPKFPHSFERRLHWNLLFLSHWRSRSACQKQMGHPHVRDTPIETGEFCRYPLKKSNVGENFGMSDIQPFQAFHTSHTPFVAPAPFGARSASLVRCDPSTNPGSERYSQPSGINKRIWWRMSQSS